MFSADYGDIGSFLSIMHGVLWLNTRKKNLEVLPVRARRQSGGSERREDEDSQER